MANQYPFSLADIVAYLDSIGADYPGGLPAESLEAAVPNQDRDTLGFGSGESGLCFLGNLRSDSENWKLLRAAIEKGLKLSPDTVYFVELSSLAGNLETLNEELEQAGVKYIVLLGEASQVALQCSYTPGIMHSWQGFSLLLTLELSEVRRDASSKKIFWQHLQTLMQEL